MDDLDSILISHGKIKKFELTQIYLFASLFLSFKNAAVPSSASSEAWQCFWSLVLTFIKAYVLDGLG